MENDLYFEETCTKKQLLEVLEVGHFTNKYVVDKVIKHVIAIENEYLIRTPQRFIINVVESSDGDFNENDNSGNP